MPMNLSRIAQVDVQVAALQWHKIFTKVPTKYISYTNVFSFDSAMELSENTRINKYLIDLVDSKQSLYRSIYALRPVELETLKTYIEIYLKTGFIRSSQSPISASIPFEKMFHSSLRLYVNYWYLNNLIIKNQYLLLLISESSDGLDHTKHFV